MNFFWFDDKEKNLTGLQSIILGSLLQRKLDEEKNYKTATLFCGYRGSPLSSLDKEIKFKEKILNENKIYFHAGLNEELACAVIAGTQNYKLFGPAKEEYADGVVGIWYGKGPGVDRSGDHIHHFNFAGSSPKGGVVLLCGDDHNCKSSTMPHETTLTLVSWYVPVLAPSCVEEISEFLIHAVELSRYSGSWIALKIVSDLADAYETVNFEKLKSFRPFVPREIFDVSIRWPDSGPEQEKRIHEQKIHAMQKYLECNEINTIIKNENNRKGVIVVGKVFHNLMKIYNYDSSKMNFDLLKIGCIWPLEKKKLEEFLKNKEEILILEEKSGVFELFLHKFLNENFIRIRIFGKNLVSPLMDMKTRDIKKYLRDSSFEKNSNIIENVEQISEISKQIKRTPYYCGGCPHNTGTKLLNGDMAVLGIGCHYLANFMPDRPTITVCPMGAEGVNWISASKFSKRDHIFVNLGDGTYFHSGILAIRAAVAARTKITYKILYNQAVAMTGGQPLDGELSLLNLTKQLLAEKVEKIYLVSHYFRENNWANFPSEVEILPKEKMNEAMKKAKEIDGVSVIIYDQMCATEKRRKQKRGLLKKENFSVMINSEICDACGDCSRKSNCLAIEVENTPFGNKRKIDESSCNLDTSCLEGHCPSFAIIENNNRKSRIELPKIEDNLSIKNKNDIDKPFDILTVGIGGTGISTLTKIICDAAVFDGFKVKAMDQTGLAQRFGEVTGRISIFNKETNSCVSDSVYDLVIGCDLYCSYGKFFENDIKKFVVNLGYYNMPEIVHGKNVEQMIDEMRQYIKRKKNGFSFDFMKFAKKYEIKSFLNILLLGSSLEDLPLSEESVIKSIKVNFSRNEAEKNIEILKLGKFLRKNSFDFEEKEMTISDLYELYIDKLNSKERKKLQEIYNILEKMKFENENHENKIKRRILKSYFDLLYVKNEKEVSKLWINYIENTLFEKNMNLMDKIRVLSNVKIGIMLPWNRKKELKTFINGLIVYPLFKMISGFDFMTGIAEFMDSTHDLDKRYRNYALDILDKNLIGKLNLEELNKDMDRIEKVRGYGIVRQKNIENYFPELFA
jgi:TPP-dependent indolepyruvate ferredoxin oxidoreductase alpha subunit/Pyruvate/2-oxoacid:ferredoxin oxidoreductase gamma subunit